MLWPSDSKYVPDAQSAWDRSPTATFFYNHMSNVMQPMIKICCLFFNIFNVLHIHLRWFDPRSHGSCGGEGRCDFDLYDGEI